MRGVLVALVLVAMVLAGCADGSGANELSQGSGSSPLDRDIAQLQAGMGAVAGLLVDDRFRPIHLVEDPTGEFQAKGFILLQETGQQARTTANGEFTFVDLGPGRYTLRVTAAGHEATPQTVEVQAGEFAEISVVARRTASDSSIILTSEYSVFAFCAANALLPLTDACNLLDLSGDSGRMFLTADYTPFNQTMTALVTEFKANQEGNYFIMMGYGLADLGGPTEYFINEYVRGDYTRCINVIGEQYEPCLDTSLGNDFHVAQPLSYILYINGMMDQEINEILFGLPLTGVGASVAVQGTFLLSAFLGPPEVDLDSYCVLC